MHITHFFSAKFFCKAVALLALCLSACAEVENIQPTKKSSAALQDSTSNEGSFGFTIQTDWDGTIERKF